MKKEYNLNIKVVTRHPATRNSKSILEARAKFVINYSLQAFERYELDPIVLVICTNTLSDCIAKAVEEATDFPACYSFPSTGWASRCLIVSKPRVQECIDTILLDPFVALIQVLENQDREYIKILELIDKQASSEVVAKAIKTLQSQNQATKRKFSDVDVCPSSTIPPLSSSWKKFIFGNYSMKNGNLKKLVKLFVKCGPKTG
ncbi:hypothetical protein HMPREF1544_10758 [Mucor circinelloides 1006PhL]|uniref:Uncharacterized protein n=1 Tax=Mucor circinelloides f. circinelloides (strain 1006PhL) TaxID=1220926 RepID=S2JRT3_MUCC1|nr:hypothetical protein HMPREF1544_10758 [Mucor circinelloides 1006PhL]